MPKRLGDTLKETTNRHKEQAAAAAYSAQALARATLDARAKEKADAIIPTLPRRLKAAAAEGKSHLDITKDITGQGMHFTLFDDEMLAVANKIYSWALAQGITCDIGDVDYGTGSDPGPPSQSCYLRWA